MLLVYQAFNLVKNAPFFRRKERKESRCLQGVGGVATVGMRRSVGSALPHPSLRDRESSRGEVSKWPHLCAGWEFLGGLSLGKRCRDRPAV
jgi:hypothetical protein